MLIRKTTCWIGLLLLLSATASLGGGKEAYRNYFLGSYYFSEGSFSRAENHLQRAYQLKPEEFNFALAYALALGRQGKTAAAETLLGKSRNLLPSAHPDYYHLLSLQHFVAAMVFVYAEQYGRAIRPLRQAIQLQDDLHYPEERSIMLNALGFVEVMDQGRGSGQHGDLGEHYHVHRRDLERALDHFRLAYRADVHNASAAENYQLLMDTLNMPAEHIVEDEPSRPRREYVSSKYSHLPAYMQPILEFIEYDEVVLLLDISGSMVMETVTCLGSDRFQTMRETAQLLLENFSDSTAVGIGTIGGDCGTEPRLWYPVDSLSRKDLGYALQFLVPDGTTPLLTILQETPTLFSDDPATSKALIFISDGENICRMPGVDICEWTESLHGEITINIMTFLGASLDNSNAFAEYTCLAENTYGRVIYLDGNTCYLEHYQFDLVKACQFTLPEIQRLQCWGPAVDGLWGIFPE